MWQAGAGIKVNSFCANTSRSQAVGGFSPEQLQPQQLQVVKGQRDIAKGATWN